MWAAGRERFARSRLLALTLIAVLGVGVTNVVVSVAVAAVPVYVRLVRGVALSLRQETFIEAACALGASEWRSWRGTCCPTRSRP